jgi:hypothetical protein
MAAQPKRSRSRREIQRINICDRKSQQVLVRSLVATTLVERVLGGYNFLRALGDESAMDRDQRYYLSLAERCFDAARDSEDGDPHVAAALRELGRRYALEAERCAAAFAEAADAWPASGPLS